MKSVLIVEDNKKHMEALHTLLSDIEDIQIIKAYNMTEACYMLSLYDFSLFIVDIILDTEKANDVSGINLVKHIRDIERYEFTPVIFITSLEDPQLYTYRDLHCYQYIEKPFDKEKTLEIINEALKFPIAKNENKSVYFRKEGIIYSVNTGEITYITTGRSGTVIFTIRDCLTLGYYSVTQVLQILDAECFVQCNRNTIVNKNHIEYIDLTNRFIKLKHIKEKLEIGVTMRNKFR